MSGPIKPAKPTPFRDWKKATESALYSFANLRTLQHLPHHETSLKFLERLRDDPGVKHVMRKHKYSVGLLLEMEPAGNTTHEGKTLGLNRNKGEVIEVRLRTDWYDGWRDYKTVRKTLMHELAHIEFSEHDRDFWNLTNLLEKECIEADWTVGGRALTNEVFYNPPEQEKQDEAGWKGGSFKLGGGGTTKSSTTGAEKPVGQELTRREIMARAAEERMKKLAAAAAASSTSASASASASTK
ncbi:WLM domain-containing protein [Morchella snyderi]|nr:WLM domain-containing protein [Morchella snyderi]